jgi:hypothetical protein
MLFLLFAIDLVVGCVKNIVKFGTIDFHAKMRKTGYMLSYSAIAVTLLIIGDKQGDVELFLSLKKYLAYAFAYFYFKNITHNFCKIFPNNETLAFIAYFVGFEFQKLFPALKSWSFDKEKRNYEKAVRNLEKEKKQKQNETKS